MQNKLIFYKYYTFYKLFNVLNVMLTYNVHYILYIGVYRIKLISWVKLYNSVGKKKAVIGKVLPGLMTGE